MTRMQQAWQDRLDAGEPLALDPGDYECAELYIPSGASIRGAGRLATRIRVGRWIASGTLDLADLTLQDPDRPPMTASWSTVFVGQDLLDATIRNVDIRDGGMLLWRPLRTRIEGCRFARTRGGPGLALRNAWGCSIAGCHAMEAQGEQGIAIGFSLGDSTTCSIFNCHAISNLGNGFDIPNSQFISVMGCHAIANGQQGYAFDQMGGTASDCVIVGNLASSNTDAGFWFGATTPAGETPVKTARLSACHNRAIGNWRGFYMDPKAFDETCRWEDNLG